MVLDRRCQTCGCQTGENPESVHVTFLLMLPVSYSPALVDAYTCHIYTYLHTRFIKIRPSFHKHRPPPTILFFFIKSLFIFCLVLGPRVPAPRLKHLHIAHQVYTSSPALCTHLHHNCSHRTRQPTSGPVSVVIRVWSAKLHCDNL